MARKTMSKRAKTSEFFTYSGEREMPRLPPELYTFIAPYLGDGDKESLAAATMFSHGSLRGITDEMQRVGFHVSNRHWLSSVDTYKRRRATDAKGLSPISKGDLLKYAPLDVIQLHKKTVGDIVFKEALLVFFNRWDIDIDALVTATNSEREGFLRWQANGRVCRYLTEDVSVPVILSVLKWLKRCDDTIGTTYAREYTQGVVDYALERLGKEGYTDEMRLLDKKINLKPLVIERVPELLARCEIQILQNVWDIFNLQPYADRWRVDMVRLPRTTHGEIDTPTTVGTMRWARDHGIPWGANFNFNVMRAMPCLEWLLKNGYKFHTNELEQMYITGGSLYASILLLDHGTPVPVLSHEVRHRFPLFAEFVDATVHWRQTSTDEAKARLKSARRALFEDNPDGFFQ